MLECAAARADPMKRRRIDITGASDSSVTSLGRALTRTHDTGDDFWLPMALPKA